MLACKERDAEEIEHKHRSRGIVPKCLMLQTQFSRREVDMQAYSLQVQPPWAMLGSNGLSSRIAGEILRELLAGD
jgi:hypothetical protein